MFDFVAAGYVPVITHPERLTWIKPHYAVFVALVKSGAWMQITAGSLNGRFGEGAQYFGEKMLDDGLVHILATDAHSIRHRAPLLAEGQRAAEKLVGAEEAQRLVVERPQAILDNRPPKEVAPVPALRDGRVDPARRGFLARFMGRGPPATEGRGGTAARRGARLPPLRRPGGRELAFFASGKAAAPLRRPAWSVRRRGLAGQRTMQLSVLTIAFDRAAGRGRNPSTPWRRRVANRARGSRECRPASAR